MASRLIGYIRRDQRSFPDVPAVDAARDAAARFEQLFEPHQIVEHLDDAAASEAEIDAALEIVACRIAQDGRELALAARLTLMDPGHRLAQFAHRIIGILDMHTDRRSEEPPPELQSLMRHS